MGGSGTLVAKATNKGPNWGRVEDVAPKPEGSGPKAGTARAASGENEVQRGAS